MAIDQPALVGGAVAERADVLSLGLEDAEVAGNDVERDSRVARDARRRFQRARAEGASSGTMTRRS